MVNIYVYWCAFIFIDSDTQFFFSLKLYFVLGENLPISADPGLHSLLFATPMDRETGQLLRDPVTNKNMGC